MATTVRNTTTQPLVMDDGRVVPVDETNDASGGHLTGVDLALEPQASYYALGKLVIVGTSSPPPNPSYVTVKAPRTTTVGLLRSNGDGSAYGQWADVAPGDLGAATEADLLAHVEDTTGVHGIANTASLIVEGDARLSNARAPLAHTHPQADVTGLVAALAALLPKAGGTMTGPIVLAADPTANLHPATMQWVQARIAALINGAPGTLDTLKEIADQLASDESAVAALTSTVAGKLGASANLSDLVNAATARTNLGLGTAATQASGAFDAAGAAAAAQAASQPLDADLTAIAALATTSYGRSLLTSADAAAVLAAIGAAAASHSHAQSDVTGLVAALAAKQDASTAATDAELAAAITAHAGASDPHGDRAYAASLLGAADAMLYKGALNCSANPNYPAADAGWFYKVSAAGKIGGASGINVEVGDSLICTVDGTAAGTQASVGGSWTILQTNIDGALTGPAASTAGNLLSFNGTTGKVAQDAGVAASTDGTLAANSDAKLPTEKAVKTYVATASGLLVPKSLVDAKGDLLVGSADDTVARLAVGTNGQVLTADSAATNGVKWATPSAGGSTLVKGSTTVTTSPGSNSGSVTITHGLGATPTAANVEFGTTPTFTAGANTFAVVKAVGSFTSTQFVITVSTSNGSNVGSNFTYTVYWTAC